MKTHIVRGLDVAAGFFLLLILLCAGPVSTAQDSKVPPKYKKILVYAKIEQAPIRQQLEDKMVQLLKDKGYDAITTWQNFSPEDMASLETFSARAVALQVDGLVAFTVLGVESKVVNTPQVSASVGVPVRIGFASVYVGSTVPLGGGPKEEKTATVKGSFYNSESKTPVYYITLSGKMTSDLTPLINDFAKKTLKGLQKNKIL